MEVNTLILGSGFLGRQIKKDLVDKVLCVSRTGYGDLNLDLSVAESFNNLPDNVKNIVFSASPDNSSPESYRDTYITMLKSSIEYAKRIKVLNKFILISSTGVYGISNGSWVSEDSEPEPIKETSKIILEAENILIDSNLNYVILRFGGIYGPGRYRMIDIAKSQTSFEPEYSNRIHVRDCSRLVQFAIENLNGLFIGVDNYPCDKNEVLTWIRAELGLECNTYKNTPINKGKRCSNKKLLSAGFVFQYPDFISGYREMLSEF